MNGRSSTSLQHFIRVMLAAFLLLSAMYIARGILIPIVFAALMAMLLLPVSIKLEKIFPRWLAILCSVIILVFLALILVSSFTYQILDIAEDLPRQQEAIRAKTEKLQAWISDLTDITRERQAVLVKERIGTFVDHGADYMKSLFLGATGLLGDFILVLVYTYLFLYSRRRFQSFALWITPPEKQENLKLIIERSSHITGRYLSGVLIDVSILAVINSVGFIIVGVDYPIFFGVLVAIFNIIPYVGIPIASVFPILMAFVTSDSYWTAVGVVIVISIGQFIDNNFLTPVIVGDKVNLNALTTVVALLVGSALWGIAGMILIIPLLGVIRIILSNSENLKPYAYLISSYDEDTAASAPSFISRIYKWLIEKWNSRRRK